MAWKFVVKNVHFVGIGGVGMSGIAEVMMNLGYHVTGSDIAESDTTRHLAEMGATIWLGHDASHVAGADAVVISSAVHEENPEVVEARAQHIPVVPRAVMLAELMRLRKGIAIAGTHGKTTTSTLVAWLNRALTGGGSAFLGGISKNFGGNLVLDGCGVQGMRPPAGEGCAAAGFRLSGGRLAVEADEFDRSFLRLYPDVAVVTSADADHLDIYGTHEAVKEAFAQFVRQIRPDGYLIIKQGLDIVIDNPEITVYRYAYDTPCDFYARNVQLLEGGHYRYDIVTPGGVIEGCTLGIPGWINIENSVAAVASGIL